jgi:hypothetical protein
MSAPEYPVLDREHLEALDALHPERCADPKDSERDVWRKVGARELVRRLILEYKQANKR